MPYPSDVTNKQWSLIASYFEPKRNFGRPLTHSRREIVNAIFYMTKAGCQWRMLSSE
ncbi:MAG TPA: transposase [Alphaproteobacteria bacterium]|nr:transposase [Alphaproteobacteria bacterium]